MRIAFCFAAVASLAASPALAGPVVDDAAKAAQTWLGLIDAGAYGQSWQAAGDLFRAHVTVAAWTLEVQPTRHDLGPVSARAFAGEQESQTMAGGPDGDWKVLQFSTSFAKKAAATETVVMLKQPDGWKVDGYFIK
jgi:hypothetical protein